MALDLGSILSTLGITALRQFGDEIVGRCPMHEQRTGKADHKPSWSMNQTTYRHQCFSCGYRGSLVGLFIDLTGEPPDDLEKTLAREGFSQKWQQWEKARQQPDEVLENVVPTLTEYALTHILGDVPDHLLRFRNLLRSAIDAYEVRWDHDTRRWVLPLRSTEGTLLGAQYRQKGSVLTLPVGIPKAKLFFGFAQCADRDYCALVESPLDAVRLSGLGIPALSSLGAWVSRDQIRLLARCFTRVYVALDDDRVGREAADQLCPALCKAGTCPFRWSYHGLFDVDGAPAKDVGDVADDDALLASWSRTLRMGL